MTTTPKPQPDPAPAIAASKDAASKDAAAKAPAPASPANAPAPGTASPPRETAAPPPESAAPAPRATKPRAKPAKPKPPPAAEPGAAEQPSARGRRGRGAIQRLVRKLRPPKSGAELRESIEELIDSAETEPKVMPVEADERRLLRNILRLHRITAQDVMVPRADIVAVEFGTALSAFVDQARKQPHSRFPIYRGKLDEIVGMVHVKDVLSFWGAERPFSIEAVLRKVLFAAPSMPVLDLLAEMRDSRLHLALVVDEFGGIDGLVTIEDIVEEIVGEIVDEHDDGTAPLLLEERPGIVVVDARIKLDVFERRCGAFTAEEERAESDTLGGLVAFLAQRVPARGEIIRHSSGVEFEVVDADPRRVRLLRVRNLKPPAAA
jgi:CBS domain containing-hemolysin-like protein